MRRGGGLSAGFRRSRLVAFPGAARASGHTRRVFEAMDAECVACYLCVNVCPVETSITMERLLAGAVVLRTGRVVQVGPADWTTHPNNLGAVAAE